jgi:hypothetical protein
LLLAKEKGWSRGHNMSKQTYSSGFVFKGSTFNFAFNALLAKGYLFHFIQVNFLGSLGEGETSSVMSVESEFSIVK